MSQDELDELFGEEMSDIEEERLSIKVSKFSDSENERKEEEGEEEEDEEGYTNSQVETNELFLTSVQKPSTQGLIVRKIFD